jgi:hypothetical protein
MTEDYLRREVSIADYCFMVNAKSVLIHRSGRRYLIHTPASRAARELDRAACDRASECTQHLVASALAVLICAMLAAAIWFTFFAPYLSVSHAP